MINFIFKKKKIVVECFTDNPNALEYFPVKHASAFLPDWWKNLPKTYEVEESNGIRFRRPTMKSCDGFTNLYKRGFMIPLWSDLVIETSSTNFKWTYADGQSDLSFHDVDQMSTEFISYAQFKISSPWRIRESTGVKFVFMQPTYNYTKEFFDLHIIPGVVDFKYQHATNINVFAQKGRRFEMFAGKPLAHLIPLTDEDIEIECKAIQIDNFDEVKLLNNNYPWFIGSYKKTKKIVDEQEKCPFHRGKNK